MLRGHPSGKTFCKKGTQVPFTPDEATLIDVALRVLPKEFKRMWQAEIQSILTKIGEKA